MLTDAQKDLITATLPILKEQGVALTTYFYQRMLKQHSELKAVFNIDHQMSGMQPKALAMSLLAYAEHIHDPQVLEKLITFIAHKHVSLNIQADHYAIVGENLIASMSELLNVPLESELIVAWQVAYQQLANVFIDMEAGIYTKNEAVGGWKGWQTFTLVKKEQESSEVCSFYLQLKNGSSLPVFKAGQYVSVRVWVESLGLTQARQYTLSDSADKNYYRISVKRESGETATAKGYVSTMLHDILQIDDEVELSMPGGDFYLQQGNCPVVLLSAGIGITPMLSILNQLHHQNMPRPVYLVHAFYQLEDRIQATFLDELEQKYPQVTLYHFYEKGDVQNCSNHYIGKMDLSRIKDAVITTDAEYYLCGSLQFMQEQQNKLAEFGISKTQIYSESFSTAGISYT